MKLVLLRKIENRSFVAHKFVAFIAYHPSINCYRLIKLCNVYY